MNDKYKGLTQDSERQKKPFPFALRPGTGKPKMKFICKTKCLFRDRVWDEGEILKVATAAEAEALPRHFIVFGSEEAEDFLETLEGKANIVKAQDAPKVLSKADVLS